MSIETKIDELIAALDRNTAAQAGCAKQPKAEKPKKPDKGQEGWVPSRDRLTEEKVVEEATSIKPEAVKGAVDGMLKANRRDDAIELLASFSGAKSASDITKQGQEVMAAFIAKAEEILLGA